MSPPLRYRGRLAPSPTGLLHVGHARTFWTAQLRVQAAGGVLALRNDDLDGARCRPEFVAAMVEDLRWFGLCWAEGLDLGGPYGPYEQSARRPLYGQAFEQLRAAGLLYPCACSRAEVQRALTAPHAGAHEPLYPGTCRSASPNRPRAGVNWRFRTRNGEPVEFTDGALDRQRAVAGVDFGDMLVWRKDDLPSYQLACVVDDAAMAMTEVVRGADLVESTFQQLLLYAALGLPPPAFYHAPLVTDERGVRLAKRDGARSLRALRAAGLSPEELRAEWRGFD